MLTTKLLTAAATVSILSSLIVVLTPILFSTMRYKLFMRVVALISVGDIIGNFPYLLPFGREGVNWWCTLQGLMNFIGYPMEWLWTFALVYLLYELAVYGRVPKSIAHIHILCTVFPVLIATLQFLFGPIEPNLDRSEVCTMSLSSDSALLYHMITYYGLFVFSLLGMAVLYWRMVVFQAAHPPENAIQRSTRAVSQIALSTYPPLMVIFWIPHILVATGIIGCSIFT